MSLFRVTGLLLVVVGVLAVAMYPLHLLFRVDPLAEASGYSYYVTSTFGTMAIVWGLALHLSVGSDAGRRALAVPSAIGFLLLAVTRLFTIPFNTYVFRMFPSETWSTVLSIVEFVVFGGLALCFWRARSLPRAHTRALADHPDVEMAGRSPASPGWPRGAGPHR